MYMIMTQTISGFRFVLVPYFVIWRYYK